MLIDQGTAREALLVVTAINGFPNEDGKYWAEFYPVDLLLDLKNQDKLLVGHPLLDLKTDNDSITVMAESLKPYIVNRIRSWAKLGHFVALKRITIRGKPTGKVGFTWRKGDDYLSEVDLWWLENIAKSGALVAEKLQAIAQIADFFRAFYPIAEKHAKRRPPRPKLKRKERRRLEKL